MTAWAVRRAGGKPLRIRPDKRVPSQLDGLILGGGADVSPHLYGQHAIDYSGDASVQRSWLDVGIAFVIGLLLFVLRRLLRLPRHVGTDSHRDQLEMKLLEEANHSELPVLGICRGAQLINVYAAGSLHQKIDAYEVAPRWTVLPSKRVELVANTHFYEVLGVSHCYVNHLHNQAINAVAPGFRVVATDDHGVIQAIEGHHGRWFGVQWHPEYLPQSKLQRRLFERLVALAGEDEYPAKIESK